MPVRMKRVPKCLLRSNYAPQTPARRLGLGLLVCYRPLARLLRLVFLSARGDRLDLEQEGQAPQPSAATLHFCEPPAAIVR